MTDSLMQAGVCVEPFRFEVQHRPRPETVPEGWVLVDLARVGPCGTDYHILEGRHPDLAYPRGIGHEPSGHVAGDAAGWRKGQRVVVNPYIACGTCHARRRGKPNCCMAIAASRAFTATAACARASRFRRGTSTPPRGFRPTRPRWSNSWPSPPMPSAGPR